MVVEDIPVKILLIGLIGGIGFAMLFPLAQVKHPDEGEYHQTPTGLYLANQFTDKCWGYPVNNSETCEFRLPLLNQVKSLTQIETEEGLNQTEKQIISNQDKFLGFFINE